MYFWSRKQLYCILPLQKNSKITSLIFIKENKKLNLSMCCYRPRDRLKHSVSWYGYNDYIGVWADIWCCETRILTSSNISHHFHMPQCSWKALREENATPPQCTPIKIHGNSKNVNEISKLSCVADFKRKFQLDCMFPSSAGGKGWKDKEKSSLSSKMRYPYFLYRAL